MRSSIITGTSYLPGTVLDSTVSRKVMNINQEHPEQSAIDLTLGGTFRINGKLTRIIERELDNDKIIINGFIKFNNNVYHVLQRIIFDKKIFAFCDVRGISALVAAVTRNQYVYSLRDYVSDMVIGVTDPVEFDDLIITRENMRDPVWSNLDNEGSSIFDAVDAFNENYLVDDLMETLSDHNAIYSGLEGMAYDVYGDDSGLALAKDIVRSMSDDDILTSGIISTFDILSNEGYGTKTEVLQQLSLPYTGKTNVEMTKTSENYVINPVLQVDDFNKYLCNNRVFVNSAVSKKNITTITQEMMRWLTDMHTSISEGYFKYTLPEKEILNISIGSNSDLPTDFMLVKAMNDFESVFAELIDFSSAREFDIGISKSEELYIRYKDKAGMYVLYFDMLMMCVLSHGLIRYVNT